MFLLQSEAKQNDHVPYRCGVSVSKRNIKLAVNRNLVKRRMREAFRIQVENSRLISTDFTSNVMLVYVGKEVISYNVIHQAIKRILKKVIIK